MKFSEIENTASRAVNQIAKTMLEKSKRDRMIHSGISDEFLKDAAAIVTTEFSALAEDDVEAALVKLREKYPHAKFISISVDATNREPFDPIRSARIQVASNAVTGKEDGGFFTKHTLAEALSAAMEGETK